VRRNDTALVSHIARHLWSAGDTAWLAQRVPVILFEECWPLGAQLMPLQGVKRAVEPLRNLLLTIATAPKYKEAAGLGSLAYALAEGDARVLQYAEDTRAVRVVTQGIQRPDTFWEWVEASTDESRQQALIQAAHRAHKRGGWPWDRAFMQAAAYLALQGSLPDKLSASPAAIPCPLWVGLDKHTPDGKAALQGAAAKLNVSSRQLGWASFYCESARVNADESGSWWQAEARWRLASVNLTPDTAQDLWERATPLVQALLAPAVEALAEHLHCSADGLLPDGMPDTACEVRDNLGIVMQQTLDVTSAQMSIPGDLPTLSEECAEPAGLPEVDSPTSDTEASAAPTAL
jgi:hypothetical protein